MQQLVFIIQTVGPVFLIIALGYLLRRLGLINQNFISLSSQIVFNVSLPVLIFLELIELDIGEAFPAGQIGYIYIGTLIFFAFLWLGARPFIHDGRDLGVFIQGSFRSNFAIVGLAVISNVFGKEGLARGSLVLGSIVPLYNTLAVIALTIPKNQGERISLGHTIFEILKNPLIIGAIFAVPFAYFNVSLPPLFRTTGEYLADIALPIALLGIGGTLHIREIKQVSMVAVVAMILKTVLSPLLLTYGAFLFGVRGLSLGILFILFGAPTAIASFIMAEAMDCNSKLAGQIVLISTLASIVTISAGLYILLKTGLIQVG
ncbi:MAG TPA: AEC family transporter [bacterium]|nr:AEC family transporter [bacterium]